MIKDDKPRTKLSKEMQEFIIWVSKQKTFEYIYEYDHWGSFKYSPKSTLQLLIHFQKNVYNKNEHTIRLING